MSRMSADHDTNTATIKMVLAWIGMAVGGITLSDIALTTTILFTVLQIFVLLRKLWRGQA